MPAPRFFRTPADFSRWLEKNHDRQSELWVGFHKKGSGRPSITWPESVDEALCWGWIDGVRKSVDETSYMIRFTPRTATSTWSEVNTRRANALIEEGRMKDPGLRAFQARKAEGSGQYSYEQRRNPKLPAAEEKRFRAKRAAWAFFEAQPPSYRRLALFWVVSAKKEETRAARLDKLIAASAEKRRL
ncbi:MAG TPA: YdeI/OmpD-associated family protein [Thermoanaerobaculia bacterium]|nr:YdeI/OmpD-associated family protein [Thermoanaerobaculia bacterium]